MNADNENMDWKNPAREVEDSLVTVTSPFVIHLPPRRFRDRGRGAAGIVSVRHMDPLAHGARQTPRPRDPATPERGTVLDIRRGWDAER